MVGRREGKRREKKIRGEAAATHLGDDYCFLQNKAVSSLVGGGVGVDIALRLSGRVTSAAGRQEWGEEEGVNSGRGGEIELRSSFAACSHLLSGRGDETGATRNPSPLLTISLTEFFFFFCGEAHS